jgi:hypothetical protein
MGNKGQETAFVLTGGDSKEAQRWLIASQDKNHKLMICTESILAQANIIPGTAAAYDNGCCHSCHFCYRSCLFVWFAAESIGR